MSKSDAFETDVLNHIFKSIAIPTLGATIYTALHTADPGDTGNASTNEVSYTGYARVGITRGAGFTVTGNSVSPAANITFPASTGGGATATHFSYSVASTGTAKILYSGTVSPSIVITSGGQAPVLTTASAVTES